MLAPTFLMILVILFVPKFIILHSDTNIDILYLKYIERNDADYVKYLF